MTAVDKREILKADLQLTTTAFDKYLDHLLQVAAQLITREGIKLQDSAEDAQLQIMYAAWLYRKRASEDTTMPRMLRWALNNRLVSQKGALRNAT